MGTIQPLEVLWSALMLLCVVFESLMLAVAYSDRWFIKERQIDSGSIAIANRDITLAWLRLSGSVALLGVGVLSLFTPSPVREQVKLLTVVSGFAFVYFGIERIVHDVVAFLGRRKMLSLSGVQMKGFFVYQRRKHGQWSKGRR